MPTSATRRQSPSRPRTSQSSGGRLSARQAVGREEARPGEYEIELLEYEWPDLPPIPNMKDAITRRRVSNGITYLLPVDKGKNSINSHFRTDLRAMFQEPYASDDLKYDDGRVKLSAKVHFTSNTADTKWTKDHLRSLPVELNANSEQVRKLYTRSAPSSASASRRMGVDPGKLRKRSNLYLPIKARVPPEAIKIRKEVEKIIKSVQEDDGEYDESKGAVHEDNVEDTTHVPERRKTLVFDDSMVMDGNQRVSSLTNRFKKIDSPYGKQHFNSYEELRRAKPPRITIPVAFKSQFLSEEKNQEIWDWLHDGDALNDFEYFLSVCG
ncbi:uncharacterized protein LOC124275631 [Haliotis rubra]|uniref:uncharacterized protein LOC124275631 n=1 Tax=Haliotis rubra TaxID=36100 RepID=UPI001EE59249|nr:uncharacterized protein LOC124275631 [Haliotis rubra]